VSIALSTVAEQPCPLKTVSPISSKKFLMDCSIFIMEQSIRNLRRKIDEIERFKSKFSGLNKKREAKVTFLGKFDEMHKHYYHRLQRIIAFSDI
jgi:hypothetical protein